MVLLIGQLWILTWVGRLRSKRTGWERQGKEKGGEKDIWIKSFLTPCYEIMKKYQPKMYFKELNCCTVLPTGQISNVGAKVGSSMAHVQVANNLMAE